MRTVVFALSTLFTLVACGQTEGVCVASDAGKESCMRSQQNTCEKMGGRWEAYKDDKAFDKAADSCSKLGFTQPGSAGAFRKPDPR